MFLTGHFLRSLESLKTPFEKRPIINAITIVSSGHAGRAGISSLAEMRLARKSQGFGKICGETFPRYIKIRSALGTGAVHPAGVNDPTILNIDLLIYDKNIEIEQIRLSVWQ